MALTLSEIETLARHESRDDELSITSGTGLSVFNFLYRRYASLFVWPELTRTSTTTTTAGTSQYTWPSTYRFSDVRKVEIQNPNMDDNYVIVMPARSEVIFSKYSRCDDGFPAVYRRDYDGSNNVLSLAPAPSFSGSTVKITGIAEPENLSSGSDATVFLDRTSDDGLAYLIAADYMFKRADPERANQLLSVVGEILSRKAGKEILPQEIREKVGV